MCLWVFGWVFGAKVRDLRDLWCSWGCFAEPGGRVFVRLCGPRHFGYVVHTSFMWCTLRLGEVFGWGLEKPHGVLVSSLYFTRPMGWLPGTPETARRRGGLKPESQ